MDRKIYSNYYLNQARTGIINFGLHKKGGTFYMTPSKPFDTSLQETFTKGCVSETTRTSTKRRYFSSGTEACDEIESNDSDIEQSEMSSDGENSDVGTDDSSNDEEDDTNDEDITESNNEGDTNSNDESDDDDASIDDYSNDATSIEESEEQLGDEKGPLMYVTGTKSRIGKIKPVKGSDMSHKSDNSLPSSKLQSVYPVKKRSKFDKLF